MLRHCGFAQNNDSDESDSDDEVSLSCYVLDPTQLNKVGLTIDSFREYTNTDNDTVVASTLTNESIVQAIIDKRDPPCHI